MLPVDLLRNPEVGRCQPVALLDVGSSHHGVGGVGLSVRISYRVGAGQ